MFKLLATAIVLSEARCRLFPRTMAVALAAFLLAILSHTAARGGDPPRRPNIVLILADDLGYGDIGCYGNTFNRTPHLDGLARRGMRFTDFHSSGTVCSPTRAGLMTGRYQQRAGIPGVITAANHRHLGLDPGEITFAKLLNDAGYATAIFGKWHLGYQPKFNPIRHGFQEFRGFVSGNVDYFSHVDQTGVFDWWHNDKLKDEEGYTTELITRHAVRFIHENKARPFCLYLPHEAPHSPYQGPKDAAERTVGGKFPIAGSRTDVKQAYREMVESLDDSVGQVIAALRECGIEDQTLVWFFSDNGANPRGSNGPLRGHKGSVWEGGHRVPAITAWPGKIPAGVEPDQLTISLDVFPTLLALAGVAEPPDHKLDGVNLNPLLLDKHPLPHRRLFWGYGSQRAMRKGAWKLVSGVRELGDRPALFNLDQDLGEIRDLSDEHPERVREMLEAIKQWEAEVGPSEFERKPAAGK